VILYPALDILDGQVVRLAQGDFARSTTYAAEPLEAARQWAAAGAERLHIVDLDGARRGEPANLEKIAGIVRDTGLEVQVGGGLRTLAAIDAALASGAARAVIGTAAFNDPQLLAAALERHGKRIAVSVDARNGVVTTAGWRETTEIAAVEAVRALASEAVIYTDVERDGMLEGPDLEGLAALSEAFAGELIYAGGIGTLEHLRALAGLGAGRLTGVIVGKALYEGRFTIAEARAALCS
jgi:phosphoribosylformimino-5-aminoimidazole carboxamide ribotide isomerase